MCDLDQIFGVQCPHGFVLEQAGNEFGNHGVGSEVNGVARMHEGHEIAQFDLFSLDFHINCFLKQIGPQRPNGHILVRKDS